MNAIDPSPKQPCHAILQTDGRDEEKNQLCDPTLPAQRFSGSVPVTIKAWHRVAAYIGLSATMLVGYYIIDNSRNVVEFKDSTKALWTKLFTHPSISDFAFVSDFKARQALSFVQSVEDKDKIAYCTLLPVSSPPLPDRVVDVGPTRRTFSCNQGDRQLSISFVKTSNGPKCYWIHYYRYGQPQLDIGGY